MSDILGIRPFVPATDFDRSTGFYETLGFSLFYKDSSVALLRLGKFAFLLQNFSVGALAADRPSSSWSVTRTAPGRR